MDAFIREVRRPGGHQYRAESIYYLCLGKTKNFQCQSLIMIFIGIQFYLNINNRQIDLFDPGHIEFNSTLNKILQEYVPRVHTDSKSNSLIDFFF